MNYHAIIALLETTLLDIEKHIEAILQSKKRIGDRLKEIKETGFKAPPPPEG